MFLFLWSADFFSKLTFSKNSFRNTMQKWKVPLPRSHWQVNFHLSIFLYSGDHKWSFSEVSVLEFLRKKKSFWLSHLNECPELLCGLSCDHRWSQTIPMKNSPWEKRILQGITISLGPAILWVVWWPGRSCTLRRGQVLVYLSTDI